MNQIVNPKEYIIIHPLDDIPEKKVDVSKLGIIKLTKIVKTSLFILRIYLIVIVILVFYGVIKKF